jgi:hypothetical protein
MRRSCSFLLAIVLILSIFAGCNQSAQMERKYPREIYLSRTYFDFLRNGQYEKVENDFDPLIKDRTEFRPEFDKLVATIPKESPISVTPKWIKVECDHSFCLHQIILEYRYRNELLLFNVVGREEGSQTSIMGMHARIIPGAALAANEFRLFNKGIPQYVILIMAILFPLFSLYVLVLCIRSKIGARKWPWAIIILIGVFRFGVNWTTGEPTFRPLAIQFLSVSASAEPYGPWTVYVSIPLGAILFLLAEFYGRPITNSMSTSNK